MLDIMLTLMPDDDTERCPGFCDGHYMDTGGKFGNVRSDNECLKGLIY